MKLSFWFSLLWLLPIPLHAFQSTKPVLVDVKRIWDAAPHNAFTDLVHHDGRWYCVFREGSKHVSPDGSLRVITSTDGTNWTSAALIQSKTSDLRDAKLTVTPNGRLMLSGAEAVSNAAYTHQSLAWFSWDGLHWSSPTSIGDKDNWLWRTTWSPDGTAYGFGYGTNKNRLLRFYSSKDGSKFATVIENVAGLGTYPNETSIVFEPNKTAWCLLRQDGNPKDGLLGTASPPYDNWTWKSLGTRIGGPQMIRLPDGRFFACVRLYDNPVRTSLCSVDVNNAKLTEVLKLPSGGDTSYAGMVWHDEQLWISYYSSHESKTSIYLARVRLD
ncbi:MAG: sialidase family protein [Planctomycetaceae bacterium]